MTRFLGGMWAMELHVWLGGAGGAELLYWKVALAPFAVTTTSSQCRCTLNVRLRASAMTTTGIMNRKCIPRPPLLPQKKVGGVTAG